MLNLFKLKTVYEVESFRSRLILANILEKSIFHQYNNF